MNDNATRAPWASRRWTIIAAGMVLLLILQLLGASEEVLAPLAMGIGGAMTALQAGESWVDRARARRWPRSEPLPPSYETEAGAGPCPSCRREDY